ncbi:MAG: hypothetical protein ACHP6I_03045, partial [Rickettsiales bacterium]
PKITKIDYVGLIHKYNINIKELITNLPSVEISHEFTKKIIGEFSKSITEKLESRNSVLNVLRFYRPNHQGFRDTPNVIDFLNALRRCGLSQQAIDEYMSTSDRSVDYSKDLTVTRQLQKKLTSYRIFTSDSVNAELNRIMSFVGNHVKRRVGVKFPWFLDEFLSILSGLAGGLPFFSSIYQVDKVIGYYSYAITPIAAAVVFLVEQVLKPLIAKEEKRFADEYKEYESKIEKLLQKNRISIIGLDGDTLKSEHLAGDESFNQCINIIGKTLERIYFKANITKESLSDKENAFVTIRLFNALSDALLRLDNRIQFDDQAKIERVIETVAKKYADRIVKSRFMAAYRGCWAEASFKEGLSKTIILDDIVSILGTANANIDSATITQISHDARAFSNSVYLGGGSAINQYWAV